MSKPRPCSKPHGKGNSVGMNLKPGSVFHLIPRGLPR